MGIADIKTGPESWLACRHILILLIISFDNFASLDPTGDVFGEKKKKKLLGGKDDCHSW